MIILREYGEWVRQASTSDESTDMTKKQYIEFIKFVIKELEQNKSFFDLKNKNIIINAYINKCRTIIDMIEEFFNNEKLYGLHHIFLGNIYYEKHKCLTGSSNCSIYCEIDLETYDKFKPIVEEIIELKKNCCYLNVEAINNLNKFAELFNRHIKLLNDYSFSNYFTKRFNKKTLITNDFINHLKEIGKEKILNKLYYCTENEYYENIN